MKPGTDACELLCLDLPKAESVRSSLPDAEVLESGASFAKALADPNRLSIALALRDGGEMCVCDLSWIVGRQDKLVSHHLRLLRSAGLAASRKDGKMVLYTLTPAGSHMVDAVRSISAPVIS